MAARTAVAVLLGVGSALAVRRLDLTATEGEVAGKYAFEGGEPEATCKACKAVMEHIERAMAKPYYDNYHHTYKDKQKRGVDARRLNKVDRINQVLDASACREEMKAYDLAYIGGSNTFHYKEPGTHANWPVHMELNEWAKNELGSFCESLIEEYEDELTTLLMEDDEENKVVGKPNATMRVCKDQLALCVPPPPPPPPKKKKKEKPKTRKQILEQARKVFADMDTDSNGHIDRTEMEQRLQAAHQAGESKSGKTVEEELEQFFESVDKDKNGKVTFYEYKFMWVSPKGKNVPGGEESEFTPGLDYYIGETLAGLVSSLPGVGDLAEKSPGAVVGGISVTTVAMCVGGRAAMRR